MKKAAEAVRRDISHQINEKYEINLNLLNINSPASSTVHALPLGRLS